MSADLQNVSVIGGGAWGTALAQTCAQAGRDVCLWAREDDVVDSINTAHENTRFLPGANLHQNVRASNDLAATAKADIVLMVVPAQFTRTVLDALKPHIHEGTPVLLCSKGIEQQSLELMSDVLIAAMPQAIPAVLSGPSFAVDVVRGLPTAVTLACTDAPLGRALMHAIGTRSFRPYLSTDIVGAEIGGAVKNVLAIACGIVLGRQLGKSAHAALLTRGFAEMTRLGIAFGAQPETLRGLCGLGDLVLTCSSEQSRNMSCGLALGRGESLDEIYAKGTGVIEGAATAPALAALAARRDVDMPISEAVAAILAGKIGIDAAIEGLLSRPFQVE
ncbi:MAG: glycerol-3-phosphate dehydrogenase [Robiginitomaculum sp.]|nr:MAG: glycerol-3-phosphate dehydrogenase [Robiginitomaculum sp.]